MDSRLAASVQGLLRKRGVEIRFDTRLSTATGLGRGARRLHRAADPDTGVDRAVLATPSCPGASLPELRRSFETTAGERARWIGPR